MCLVWGVGESILTGTLTLSVGSDSHLVSLWDILFTEDPVGVFAVCQVWASLYPCLPVTG